VVVVRSRVVAVALVVMGLVGVGAGSTVAGPVPAAESSPAPSESSANATTWAIQPSTEEGPDGRVSLRHAIEGGGEVSDVVAVTNFSDRAATFAVYASDGVVTADGSFDVLPADQEAVDAGTWITISPVDGSTPREGGGVVLEVPAGATVTLPVQIRVPDNATPGDHPAGIVAELVRADAGGVQLSSRVGLRVHLRVAGDVVAALVPEGVTVTYTPSWNPFAQGTVTVEFAVANAGNVRLGAETVASIAGPLGVAPEEVVVEQREVLPGQAAVVTAEIPVAPFFYAWGEISTTPVVVGEDDVATVLSGGTTSFTVWTVPWSQLVLLAALVGAFLLVRALRRRNAARVQARIDAAVAAATAGRAGTPPATASDDEAVTDEPPVEGGTSAEEVGATHRT
jgi:hypothetical protein